MTIIGLHNLVDPIVTRVRAGVSVDGGFSLVLMNGLVLIPLAIAALFHPATALAGLVVAGAVTGAGVVLLHVVSTRRLRHRVLSELIERAQDGAVDQV